MYAEETTPCTDKQVQFIAALVPQRALSTSLAERVDAARAAVVRGRLSRADASALIDELLDAPKAAKPAPPQRDTVEPEAGIYRTAAGVLLRVYQGQKSGRMLAKRVDIDGTEVTYTYVGAAARALGPQAQRLSLEEVGALGVASRTCLACGRRLDDPESVDRGIGPVCAKGY